MGESGLFAGMLIRYGFLCKMGFRLQTHLEVWTKDTMYLIYLFLV